MYEQHHQGSGEHGSSESANQNDVSEPLTRNNEVFSDVLEIAGGIVFFALGCVFSEAQLHVFAYLSFFACIACGSLLGAGKLKKAERVTTRKWSLIVILPASILCAYLGLRSNKKDDNIVTQEALPLAASPAPKPEIEIQSPSFSEDESEITWTFGSNAITATKTTLEQRPSGLFGFGRTMIPISIYVADNKLLLDANLYTGSASGPIIIKRSKVVAFPAGCDFNHNSDWTAVEFVDKNRFPVLQIVYKTKVRVDLKGVFIVGNSVVVMD
jgi:hypothetical protein